MVRGRYGLAFLQNDAAGMAQQVAQASQISAAEDMLLSTASDTEAYYGRLSKARDLSRRLLPLLCGKTERRPPLYGS